MDIDNHRPLSRELRRIRFVHVSRNGTPVEGLPVDHLRRDKGRRIQSAGFACGPAIDFAGLRVERIAIEWRLGGAEAEGNVAIVLMPLHPANHAQRNFRSRLRPSGSGIEQTNHARSVFIGDKCNRASVFADVEIVYIPLDIAGQILRLEGSQIKISQTLEF